MTITDQHDSVVADVRRLIHLRALIPLDVSQTLCENRVRNVKRETERRHRLSDILAGPCCY
jgi:hypothetical protein